MVEPGGTSRTAMMISLSVPVRSAVFSTIRCGSAVCANAAGVNSDDTRQTEATAARRNILSFSLDGPALVNKGLVYGRKPIIARAMKAARIVGGFEIRSCEPPPPAAL